MKIEVRLRPMMAHQDSALTYARGKSRIALFMEMRLGKTAVVIRWLRRKLLKKKPNARILIVAPWSAMDGWLDELRAEFVPDAQVHLLDGTTRERLYAAKAHYSGWFLNNYDGVRILGIGLAMLEWDAIVLDESTAIRNPQAATAKVLTKLYAHVPYRAILAGLPNPESPLDFFEQFRFLHGDFCGFHNFWAFREVMFKQVGYDWIPKPGTRERIKEVAHDRAFFLTRKQAKIGNRKVYEKRVVEPSPELTRYLRQVRKEFKFGDTLETKWATTRELWLQRLAGGFSPDQNNPALISDAKYKELWSLMTGELKGQQLVVWFRFNEELLHAAKFLRAKSITVGIMMGATPHDERSKIRQQFQSGKLQVILFQLSTGKGGMGQDLSAASTAIYYSNAYEFLIRSQSEDRIEHPKKTVDGLLLIDLLTRGTVDEDAYAVIREKRSESMSFRRELWSRIVARELGTGPQDADVRQRVTRIFPD